jgi:hypothetical protein
LADTGYTNGHRSTYTRSVSGTADDLLYQTRRYADNDPNGAELAYEFPLRNGTYTVRLHFAELRRESLNAGARVFDVEAQGRVVINNLDVYSEAGPKAALSKTVRVAVTNGRLRLRFPRETGNAYVAAIEIHSGDDGDNGNKGDDHGDSGKAETKTVKLRWSASGGDIDGYRVYFGPSREATVLVLSTLRIGSTGFDSRIPGVNYDSAEDLGLDSSDTACFRVSSFRGSESSPLSGAVCGEL